MYHWIIIIRKYIKSIFHYANFQINAVKAKGTNKIREKIKDGQFTHFSNVSAASPFKWWAPFKWPTQSCAMIFKVQTSDSAIDSLALLFHNVYGCVICRHRMTAITKTADVIDFSSIFFPFSMPFSDLSTICKAVKTDLVDFNLAGFACDGAMGRVISVAFGNQLKEIRVFVILLNDDRVSFRQSVIHCTIPNITDTWKWQTFCIGWRKARTRK